MNTYKYLLLLITCFISCKTISVQQEIQNTTIENIVLGSIGEQKRFALEQDYDQTALPKYSAPIKINVSAVTYSKPTYKAFDMASKTQMQKINVNYTDSLPEKPKFLKLEISDRINVINALNAKENQDVFQFLVNTDEAHIVTSISIALNANDITALINAEEVFLETDGIKNYALKAYKDSQLQQTFYFNQGVVFGYQTSNCCWKQNEKYQLQIVDLVERNNRCPKKSFKTSEYAKKKINYYKF